MSTTRTLQAPPPRAIGELRGLVASAIADEKSYNVPSLCVRLGLAGGSVDEAHRSKYRYAQQRLIEVNAEAVMSAARELLAERDSFALAEAVAKLDERASPPVTAVTRRRIMKVFDGVPLCTEIGHLDLIRKVWPIAEMQPPAGIHNGTMQDWLVRATLWNDDLTNREILEALGFLTCSGARLFSFVEEVVGPEAQTPERQAELAEKLADVLIHDGYRLAPAGKLSGSHVYAVRLAPVGSPADMAISETLSSFDPREVGPRWQAAMDSREESPGRAITLARTLLEDVCKWIITEAGDTYKEADDLPVLYRQLAKLLRLAPDDHTEQVFKQILGNCQSVVESLGALRNKLGDAHSLGPIRARPQPRHAALAVTLSGGMATFLVETWQARKAEAARRA